MFFSLFLVFKNVSTTSLPKENMKLILPLPIPKCTPITVKSKIIETTTPGGDNQMLYYSY